jgi:phosphatidate cytidylyltransferase
VWIAVTLSFAAPIARSSDYRQLIIALVVVTAGLDIGSYFGGRRFGRRALSAVLSPKKTVEGLVAGIALAMALSVAISLIPWFEPLDWKAGVALGLAVAVSAPLGDLAESLIKRSLGLKDMGTILPGHGGLLDRIDAFLFVVPTAYFLFKLLGYVA